MDEMTHGLSLERAKVTKFVRRDKMTKVFNPGAEGESVKEKLIEGLFMAIAAVTVMKPFPQI